MRSLLLSTIVVLGAISAQAASIRYHDITPCRNWSYHSHSGANSGYLCSFPGMNVQVAEALSVDRSFQTLETKILELERRIQELERKNP